MRRSADPAEHDFHDDAEYRALEYAGFDLSARKTHSLEVDDCRFTDSKLSGMVLSRATFTKSEFDQCDLANIRAEQSSLLHSKVSSSRMTGSRWGECLFRDTVFESCRIDLANFRFATFKRTVFRDCNLREADFQNADLRRITFENCDLTSARFANAQMDQAKFVNCVLVGIGGVTSFKGAIVESGDLAGLAYSLAGALDITVVS